MTVPYSYDDPSESLENEVDQLCDEFEASWQNGRPSTIESVLQRSAPSVRPRLLRELLYLELSYRHIRHEHPQPEAYAARFPEHESLVDDVFRELSAKTDENLLLGILALKMDLVSREQLVAAMLAWGKDKSRSLEQVFRDQGVLSEETARSLSALVATHLATRTKNFDGQTRAVQRDV